MRFFPTIRSIALASFLAVCTFAQSYAQSVTAYQFSASSGTFTALGTGASTAAPSGDPGVAANGVQNDEDYYPNIPIGFNFYYLGTSYNTALASVNGWMSLGTTLPGSFWSWNNNLTNGTAGGSYSARPSLVPFWDDLGNFSGSVKYQTTGTQPNRVFTLEWLNNHWDYNAYYLGYTPSISFQVKLYETSNKIEFVYRQESGTTSNTSGGASIGITSSGTGSGTFLSLSDAGSSPSISSTTETTNLLRPATGQIYTFSPPTPPAITIQPQNTFVCAIGPNVNLSVAASGSVSGYQWQKNVSGTWTNITGATSSSLSLPTTGSGSDGQYRVNISGTDATFSTVTVTSNVATITTSLPITITSQPPNASICPGDPSVNLSVTASGAINGYQWQKNVSGVWTNISGATSTSYNMSSSDPNTPGDYRVQITGPGNCGPAVVNSNTVTVTQRLPLTITQQPTETIGCNGVDVMLVVKATGTLFGIQWQKDGVNISASGNPTAIKDTLIIRNASSRDAGQYRAILTGTCSTPTLTSNVANVIVADPLSLTSQPKAQIVCKGSNVYLTMTTAGTAFAYQWQKDGQDINPALNPSARTAILQLNGVDYNASARYRVLVTGSAACGTPLVVSDYATVFVTTPTNVTQGGGTVPVAQGGAVSLAVEAEGVSPQSTYQWYRDNTPLVDNGHFTGTKSSVLTINGIQQSDVASTYEVMVEGVCGRDSVEYQLFIPNIGIDSNPVNAEACIGGNASFTVAASSTTPGATFTYQWMRGTQKLTNNARYSGVTSSTLNVSGATAAEAGSYHAVITVQPGNVVVNSTSANLAVNTVPVIATELQPQTICEGTQLSLDAGTMNGVTYKWMKDGAEITATGNTYTEAATASTAGNYMVIVSNSCGSDTSMATVAVNLKPVVTTQPSNVEVVEGSTLTLTVAATGSGTLSYQWLKDGQALTGETNATYTVAKSQMSNAGKYTVRVTNACGEVTSQEATVVIAPNSVSEGEAIAAGYMLNSATPNPASEEAEIRFTVPRDEKVRIVLRDALGNNVATIFDKVAQSGENKISFSLRDGKISSGVYYYTITGGRYSITRSMIVVK